MKKEKDEIEEPSAPFWMTTFSDMMTLLLVFFVLILSYSTIELEKFKGAMSSMKGALGIMPEMGSAVPSRKIQFNERMTPKNVDIRKHMEDFEKAMKESGLQDMVEAEATASGVHIRLGDNVLYDIGKAEIKNTAYSILAEISEMLLDGHKEVFVEGHTDNIPINTPKYPSNWELSTARAMSVIRYLNKVQKIPMKYMAAVGHGEYRPIVPNNSRSNRAKNRRVEIFIKWED